MKNELSNKKILEQISLCTDLLILSLQESPKKSSIANCLQAKDLLCSLYTSHPKKQLISNTRSPKPPAGQTPAAQVPVVQAPISQQTSPLKKTPIPPKLETKSQTLRPKEAVKEVIREIIKEPVSQKTIQEAISHPEPSASALLDIERSHLFKLLPRRVTIDSNPPLDLKAQGIRFTPRSRPLPHIPQKASPVIFGVTPQIIESTVLGSFIENVKKAVNEQLTTIVQPISVLTPLGFTELMAASLEKTSIFLFINTTEKEILLKLLKKIPAFKEESTQNINNLNHHFSPIGYLNDSPLLHIPLEPRALQDQTFKRSLWNALKSHTVKS